MERKTKIFEKYADAIDFAKTVKGYVYGPFVDYDGNCEYHVYYKEKI